jgi:hypothetical protein
LLIGREEMNAEKKKGLRENGGDRKTQNKEKIILEIILY